MNSDLEFATFHLNVASVFLVVMITLLISSLIFRNKKELFHLLNSVVLFLYVTAIVIFQWEYMLTNFPNYFYGLLVFWNIILILVIMDGMRLKKQSKVI